MCLAAASIIVGLAGTAMSYSAQMKQAATQEKIAERNAKMEAARGRYEAKQIDRKLRYTQSQARVNAAASGIGFSGSFLDVIADNEVQGEIDIENTRRNSQNRQNSIRYEGEAAAARTRNNAVGTLIGGIGDAFEQGASYMRTAA